MYVCACRHCVEEAAKRRRRTRSYCYFRARQISCQGGTALTVCVPLSPILLLSRASHECFSLSLSLPSSRLILPHERATDSAPMTHNTNQKHCDLWQVGVTFLFFFSFSFSRDLGCVVTVRAMTREARQRGLQWVRGCVGRGVDRDLTVRN